MTVINSLYDLAPEEFGLELRHLAIGLHLEIAMQATTVDEFHDKEDLLMRFESLIQFGDVCMV